MLVEHKEELVREPFRRLSSQPFFDYLTTKFPSLLEIPDEEFSRFITCLDTFLIIETLYGGFLTPQRIHLDSSMFDDQLFSYLQYLGYKFVISPLSFDDVITDQCCIVLLSRQKDET